MELLESGGSGKDGAGREAMYASRSGNASGAAEREKMVEAAMGLCVLLSERRCSWLDAERLFWTSVAERADENAESSRLLVVSSDSSL